jgi:eukaryotic-like serine/threonine-protein kinase
MSAERWQQVKAIFASALDLGADERQQFVERACGEDGELLAEVQSLLRYEQTQASVAEKGAGNSRRAADIRNEVERLLTHNEESGSLSEAEQAITPTRNESAESTDTLLGETISHYRVVEKLGGGGMGVVYKAEDMRLRRPVALKFLADQITSERAILQRFEREAQAASALNHPSICTIYEFSEHDGRLFLAMELIEGCSLRAFRERDTSMESLIKLVSQAAGALAAAHAAGIVHRDIKPENIMVRNDGYGGPTVTSHRC